MAERPSFMEELSKHDSEFSELFSATMAKTREIGALDQREKSLITLAVDASGSSK